MPARRFPPLWSVEETARPFAPDGCTSMPCDETSIGPVAQ